MGDLGKKSNALVQNSNNIQVIGEKNRSWDATWPMFGTTLLSVCMLLGADNAHCRSLCTGEQKRGKSYEHVGLVALRAPYD